MSAPGETQIDRARHIVDTLVPGCSAAIAVAADGSRRWFYGDVKHVGGDRIVLRLWGNAELRSFALTDVVTCTVPQLNYQRRRAICQEQRRGEPPPPPVASRGHDIDE